MTTSGDERIWPGAMRCGAVSLALREPDAHVKVYRGEGVAEGGKLPETVELALSPVCALGHVGLRFRQLRHVGRARFASANGPVTNMGFGGLRRQRYPPQ